MTEEMRRTKYDIYADILEIISMRGACTLTRVSYGANMPVDRAKKELAVLAKHGFVKESVSGGSRKFKVTKWGADYLDAYKQMRRFLAALDEE